MAQRQWFSYVIFACLLLPGILAEERALELRDITTGQLIGPAQATVTIDNTTTSFFLQQGTLHIAEGPHTLLLEIDDLTTTGRDYLWAGTVTTENEISLYPVGSLRGTVKDKLDNLVDHARLVFECSGIELMRFPTTTNEVGSFLIEYLPVGHCKIFASYKEAVGVTEIRIEKGTLNDIEIQLDRSIISLQEDGNLPLWLATGGVLLLGIFLLWKRQYGVAPAGNSKGIKNVEKPALGARATDILETLGDKEKEIATAILAQGGSTTQSKVYQATGMPKATLSRNVRSLEQKQVIEIQRIGKVRKISFTKWFLEDHHA